MIRNKQRFLYTTDYGFDGIEEREFPVKGNSLLFAGRWIFVYIIPIKCKALYIPQSIDRE